MHDYQIREHLEAVLASPEFTAAPRLQQFLRFVVDKSLNGEAHEIKEYVVATDVYGRGPDYDPQVDSTVRVEASRLRNRLRAYYERQGEQAAVRIVLPKGTYVPNFAS
jgi:hypothetical protein